jgi:L-fuculose-phosphate aldolase
VTGASAVEIAEYGRRLITDALAYGTAGNLSCRVDDHVVISATSIPYDEVRPHDLWVLPLDGEVVQEGSVAPSSETPFHLGIYAATKAAAVVHTHSTEVVAVSATLENLPAIHYSIARLGGPVPVVKYRRFGSDSLAVGIQEALCDPDGPRSAAILQNHGAVTYGSSRARRHTCAHHRRSALGRYRRAEHLCVALSRSLRQGRAHRLPRQVPRGLQAWRSGD